MEDKDKKYETPRNYDIEKSLKDKEDLQDLTDAQRDSYFQDRDAEGIENIIDGI